MLFRSYDNQVADLTIGDVLTMNISVPETALYWISFDYLSYDASILPIEFALMIDGSYPFYETRNLSFETTWVSEDKISLDRYGNEIASLPSKLIQWENKYLMDNSYRHSGALAVQLTEGEHEFKIEVTEGTFLLGNITLEAPTSVPEYVGSEAAKGSALITIEAEKFHSRSEERRVGKEG